MSDTRGVSLDLSRKATGVVYWLGSHPVATDIISLPEGDIGLQLAEFEKSLTRILNKQVAWIAYEDPFITAHSYAKQVLGMTGLIELSAHKRRLLTLGVNSGTMKKRLTGNGRAKKPEMVAAAQALYPELEIESHDVADALAAGLVLTDKLEHVPE